ncbi:hypothetical protein N234_12560 [Ralstonia pickettii DTP0602]|nr:hypothetical protein N234_12560 [Ralstonia pickettii DTP0602]
MLASWSNSGKRSNRAIRPALRTAGGAAGRCTFVNKRLYEETQELMTNVFKSMRMLETIKDGHWSHHLQAIAMLKAANIKPDMEGRNVA